MKVSSSITINLDGTDIAKAIANYIESTTSYADGVNSNNLMQGITLYADTGSGMVRASVVIATEESVD